MKRQMTLTVIDKNYNAIGSIVRSFDNEQASGNFSVCRVRVGGRRFNRISCERELYVYPDHPATSTDGMRFYDACRQALTDIDSQLYSAYVKACNRENLDPHTFQMWRVLGRLTGPV